MSLATTTRFGWPPGWNVVGWVSLLVGVLVLLVTVHWIAALAILGLVLLQRARPLDFLFSFLAVVAGATFVNYTRGGLTQELSLLAIGVVFMLFCYLLAFRIRALTAKRALVSVPLLLYLGLSVMNFVRGMVVGNSPRYAGLELFAVLALGSSLLVANLRMDRARLIIVLLTLWLVGLGHSALGMHAFKTLHVRTGSIYFTPVPGLVLMLIFNIALYARAARTRWLLMLALLPLVTHQFLSFTRGYWLGLIGGTLFSLAVFGGLRPGADQRWLRAGGLLMGLVATLVAGGVLLGVAFDIHGLAELALSRLSSSAGVKLSFETSSNVVRLVEYAHALEDILTAPWLGHGLGYFFVVREPLQQELLEQWFVHQNYLLVWLKQGLVGLGLFVTMLVSAVRMGMRGRMHGDPLAAGWCMGVAAATVFIMIDALVHFPLAEVNAAFPLALLWGVAISLTNEGHWTLRWRSHRLPDQSSLTTE